ncbi:MAG: hypothetical protein AAGF49_03195 [Pseudomonadota bacterium]
MTMRIVIHIGATKTGSSALQAMLYEQRHTLAQAGILYSEAGVVSGAHHLFAAALHPGAWRLHANDLPEDRDAYFKEAAARMLTEAKDTGAHTILISSEYFWGSFSADVYQRIAEAFSPATFEIVAFVRRQDDWVLSSYLQAVKNGEARGLQGWMPMVSRWYGGLHYYRVIKRWSHFLKTDDIHVVRYADVKGDVLGALCRTARFDVALKNGAKLVNPSPSARSLEQLLAVNGSELAPDEKALERARIMREQRQENGDRPVLSDADLDAIVRAALPSDRLLGRAYLGGPGLLENLPARQAQPAQAAREGTC